MNKTVVNKAVVKGWTQKRLIDTPKFYEYIKSTNVKIGKYVNNYNVLYLKALDLGISKEQLDHFTDLSAKEMFAGNKLWYLLKKLTNKDIIIPFVTGYWTKDAVIANLVTTRGKRIVAEQLNGVSTAPVTAIAIGTGTNAAAAGDTALQTETTTNGGARGAATTSDQTTTTTGDTARWVKTFTFTGSVAVTEEGLFDNNTSGGNMLARQVFSAVNVVNTDTLQITHNVQFT